MEGGEVKEVWAEGTFEGEDEKVVGDEGMVEGTRGTGREGGTVDEHGMVAQLGEIEMGDEEVEEVQQEGAVEAGSGVGPMSGRRRAIEGGPTPESTLLGFHTCSITHFFL